MAAGGSDILLVMQNYNSAHNPKIGPMFMFKSWNWGSRTHLTCFSIELFSWTLKLSLIQTSLADALVEKVKFHSLQSEVSTQSNNANWFGSIQIHGGEDLIIVLCSWT